MRNFSISLISISSLIITSTFFQIFPTYGQVVNQLKATYVANSGYLLETKSKRILVDAVFNECIASYQCPDDSTIARLINSQVPFKQLDFVIVTHHHPDHFNDSLMVELLNARNDFNVICPEQVFQELCNIVDDPIILKRIKSVNLDTGQTASFSLGNIDLQIARSKHANTYETENLCFIIETDGIRILHTGDIFPGSIADIDPAFFHEIDLAVVPIALSSDRFKVHDTVLAPKHTILSHIKDDIKVKLKEIMKQDSVTFQDKYILFNPFDYKVFSFPNH